MKTFRWLIVIGAMIGSASTLAHDVPRRLVSLGGGVTETIYALGAGERIAAVDTTSQYPAGALEKPKVGYLRALSSEGILSLRPDAVVYTSDAGPANVLSLLEQSGLNMVELDGRRGLDGLLARIQQLGQLLHREAAARALSDAIKADNVALSVLREEADKRPRAVFLLTHGGRTPQVAGTGTTANAIMQLAGLDNVAADSVKGYKPLSVEAMAELFPEVIVTTEEGVDAFGGAEALMGQPSVRLTPAGQHQGLVAMPAVFLLGDGPRMLEAAKALHQKVQAVMAQ